MLPLSVELSQVHLRRHSRHVHFLLHGTKSQLQVQLLFLSDTQCDSGDRGAESRGAYRHFVFGWIEVGHAVRPRRIGFGIDHHCRAYICDRYLRSYNVGALRVRDRAGQRGAGHLCGDRRRDQNMNPQESSEYQILNGLQAHRGSLLDTRYRIASLLRPLHAQSKEMGRFSVRFQALIRCQRLSGRGSLHSRHHFPDRKSAL